MEEGAFAPGALGSMYLLLLLLVVPPACMLLLLVVPRYLLNGFAGGSTYLIS